MGIVQTNRNRRPELKGTALGLLRVLNLNPRSAELYNNLGILFHELKRDTDAVRCYERALFLQPDYAIALNNFGIALVSLDRYDAAVEKYKAALAIQPRFAEALNNLGVALHHLKRDEAAAMRFRQALEVQPGYFDALNNLAQSLKALEQFDEAVEKFRLAVGVQPQNIKLRLYLAETLARAQRTEEAIGAYRQVIGLQPESSDAHAGLGFLLQEIGQIAEAKASFETAISIDPRRPSYYRGWAFNSKVFDADVSFKKMQKLAEAMPSLNAAAQTQLHFALSKALADIGRQDDAFGHLLEGNRLKRETVVYDEAQELEAMSRIPGIFTAEFLLRQKRIDRDASLPVFIVGMPRSGSTLVEQILASHPVVAAAGEFRGLLETVSQVAKRNCELAIPEQAFWTPENLDEIAQTYLHALECIAAESGKRNLIRITDKRLGNYRLVGLIRMLFPTARIIHTKRNPVDTCLSCFSLLFEDTKFSYDLGELGRCYSGYRRVMQHWKEILPPDAILDVTYENVVNDIEFEARRLVAYCGLDWDPACLSFYATPRPVRTASVVQVRQPIYRDSLKKWRPGPEILRKLLDNLGHFATEDSEQPNLRQP